jgi:hypothetical protein
MHEEAAGFVQSKGAAKAGKKAEGPERDREAEPVLPSPSLCFLRRAHVSLCHSKPVDGGFEVFPGPTRGKAKSSKTRVSGWKRDSPGSGGLHTLSRAEGGHSHAARGRAA